MPGIRDREALGRDVAWASGEHSGIVAVAMAGSELVGVADRHSDIDLYVYADPIPAVAVRRSIAARFAHRSEVGNDVWEPGDEWIDANTGVHIDAMYRTPAWIEGQLDRVLVRHEASVGYSTCLWHNVLHSRALADPAGWYRQLRNAAMRPYPPELKRAIVAKNHPILREAMSSFLRQIDLAVDRADAVAVQHRVTAVLASSFDILFAVNELPHPGEKRLLRYAVSRCGKLPPDFAERVGDVLGVPSYPLSPAVVAAVGHLLDSVDALLRDEGLLPSPSRGAAM